MFSTPNRKAQRMSSKDESIKNRDRSKTETAATPPKKGLKKKKADAKNDTKGTLKRGLTSMVSGNEALPKATRVLEDPRYPILHSNYKF